MTADTVVEAIMQLNSLVALSMQHRDVRVKLAKEVAEQLEKKQTGVFYAKKFIEDVQRAIEGDL